MKLSILELLHEVEWVWTYYESSMSGQLICSMCQETEHDEDCELVRHMEELLIEARSNER